MQHWWKEWWRLHVAFYVDRDSAGDDHDDDSATDDHGDSDSGMMLLPFGMERGVEQGTVFTVWKDKREAARIRVQSSRDGFLLAYILPRFGEPQKLRPGDSIYIIPEKEQEL